MSNQIIVPSLGESVTEATVSKWLKQVGEQVDSDEPLVELETDKVNVEVPSPLAGTLSSIKVKEGDTVEVGALLGEVNESSSTLKKTTKTNPIESNKETYKPPKKSKKKIKEKEVVTLPDNTKEQNDKGTLVLEELVEDNNNEETKEEKYIPPKTRQNLSPAVRKIVEENNIDLSNVEGTGKSGRVSKGDLINLMGNIPRQSKRKITHGPEEKVKMTRLLMKKQLLPIGF